MIQRLQGRSPLSPESAARSGWIAEINQRLAAHEREVVDGIANRHGSTNKSITVLAVKELAEAASVEFDGFIIADPSRLPSSMR